MKGERAHSSSSSAMANARRAAEKAPSAAMSLRSSRHSSEIVVKKREMIASGLASILMR